MGTANTFRTDLYAIHNVIQNTQIVHVKDTFIEVLREFFSQDSYYHYVRDPYGFPKIPDHTDLPIEAGFADDDTTRLFIGEYYRFDAIYYPALLVKSAGSKYTPISFNQNIDTVEYTNTRFIDGYGNESVVVTPDHFKQNGAWEGTVSVDIETRSPRSRDELVELVSILFVNIRRIQLQNAGIHIKGMNASSPAETDDRNTKLFRQTVNFDIRTEWKRKIPVGNIIDMINICVDFGNLQERPFTLAPNIKVSTNVELVEALAEM